jgi:hypothetical protein
MFDGEMDESDDKRIGKRDDMVRSVFRGYRIKIVLASICVVLFIGLKFWNQFAPLPADNRNPKEISRIKVSDPEDFTFAVFGDNKGNYSIFEPLLHDVGKSTEIVFVIDVGDLVNEGKGGHYRRLLHQVRENLAIPFITAIGNHDLNNGSSNNYLGIFGPTYYAFQVGQSYFIVLDATAESGFNQAERQWLENELKRSQTSEVRFIFMHVPPFDPRGNGFNKCLREKDGKDLLDLFRHYNVTHLFASHIHGFFSGVWEGVPYTITGGAGGGLQGSDPRHFFYHYIKVHVSKENVDIMAKRISAEGAMARIFDIMEDDLVGWGLLLGAAVLLLPIGLSLRRKHG